MKYYLFIDETGDHGLSYIDKNFPLFLLCGLIIEENALVEIEEKIKGFKNRYFGTTNVILHSREIRKCEGAFQVLFNLAVKEQFYNDLNNILSDSDFCLVGSAVDKENHIKKYGKTASDPYALSLSFILERFIFYLDNVSQQATAEIHVEERGRKEDQQLLAYFNSINDRGTYYVSSDRLKKRIKNFCFFNKRDNIVGLQIADLCAYSMARHVLNPNEPYIPFNIIKDKIYCDKKGKYFGWGLKLFP